MWARNVLRSRRRPSAFRPHLRVRCLSSAAATDPVTPDEFKNIWEAVYNTGQWRAKKIGLAISGGVDSMALATLLTDYGSRNVFRAQCHGIIVDHKARQGSTEEAHWVAEQLRQKFDMPSTVVPVEWARPPNDTTRFETIARELRYSAFGQICKAEGITSLVVAHHGDDQAETVLMRLIMERLRSGLQGMHRVQMIPECHGMHGVHHSGQLERRTVGDSLLNSNLPFPIEEGGIDVLRPLLGIPKSRLIATCEGYGTPWVEDKTNKDRTLTTRNAVRHIMENHKLPKALSQDALCALSLRMQNRVEDCHARAERLFNSCLLRLNLQTGSLLVRFPPEASFYSSPIVTKSDRTQARNTALCLLKRLADLVSPKADGQIGQLSIAVDNIYPGLAVEDTGDLQASLTTLGLWFRRWDKPTPFVKKGDFPYRHEGEWLISREPVVLRRSEEIAITIPPRKIDSEASQDWRLFDNRFWIRVDNRSGRPLTLRPFVEFDLLQLNKDAAPSNALTSSNIHKGVHIKAALALLRPADIRYGLPALFMKKDGRDALVGLPTLDVDVIGSDDKLWEVRYRKVDLGTHSLQNCIAKIITREEIAKGAVTAIRESKEAKLKKKGQGKRLGNQSRHASHVSVYGNRVDYKIMDMSMESDEAPGMCASIRPRNLATRDPGVLEKEAAALTRSKGKMKKRKANGNMAKWLSFWAA